MPHLRGGAAAAAAAGRTVELDRACIEGYLAWNRSRGWRGQRAAAGAGRSVSAAVAQSAVLSLRNLLDDITAWGWQQAPPRRLSAMPMRRAGSS